MRSSVCSASNSHGTSSSLASSGGIDTPPGITAFDLAALPHAAADVVDDLVERDAHRQLEHAGLVDVARDAHDARAARAAHAELVEPGAALVDDERHVHQRLDVVDDRRVAEQALRPPGTAA